MDATDVSDGLHSLRSKAVEIEDTLKHVRRIPLVSIVQRTQALLADYEASS